LFAFQPLDDVIKAYPKRIYVPAGYFHDKNSG
jgi:hypothetical protein